MWGTCTLMEVAVQDLTIAGVEPNFTLLVPWLAPKLVPVMVTRAPGEAVEGEMDVIPGPSAWPTPPIWPAILLITSVAFS